MTKLFAAHLVQKTPRAFIGGEYDPEQELWVGNNQLQGNPNATGTLTSTVTERGTFTTTAVAGGNSPQDTDLDTTLEPDIDTDPDI
jgi:hypothetical protein